MKLLDQMQRLQRIDQLIRMEATGSPREFAHKLNISVSTLYELLNCMKEIGARIYYNRQKTTYVYEEPCRLIFKLEKTELGKVYGGKLPTPKKSECFYLSLY
ncbi:MAG: helix-turn-helix domain-containing protein [Bacteroidales bacterium]